MPLHCPHLSQFSRIKHAFFEEDREPLKTREARVMQELAGDALPLIVLNQVHGNTVLQVTEPWEDLRDGDGLVTNVPGIALGIQTADCAPVLLYDPQAHVIGACHAGWKGAHAGIIQATLKAMEDLGAVRASIHATLGPTIQQKNYEVGPEFPDLIGAPYDSYFYPSQKEGHHHFNLPQYVQDILVQERVGTFHDLQQNTFDSRFASRRRTIGAAKEGQYYSGLSALLLL